MADILLLNGPNLNLLGEREPEIYGSTTLAQLESGLVENASRAGFSLTCHQSNSEGGLVDRVQQARAEGVRFVIVNPGAYAHTSIALRDAFEAVRIPFIEVHISNVHARESFRHHSHLSPIAEGVICGLGVQGYALALAAAVDRIQGN
ncbi:MAG: type II 3-dehydroquinate dehydratase [Pseudomonadales bacterium]|jgi:3-dehydroquinate dehydratase-2|nr:type II 3-dehydroquinate dehydratase [Pseudomonadales bacterium]